MCVVYTLTLLAQGSLPGCTQRTSSFRAAFNQASVAHLPLSPVTQPTFQAGGGGVLGEQSVLEPW
jgi:hypothetical protein